MTLMLISLDWALNTVLINGCQAEPLFRSTCPFNSDIHNFHPITALNFYLNREMTFITRFLVIHLCGTDRKLSSMQPDLQEIFWLVKIFLFYLCMAVWASRHPR